MAEAKAGTGSGAAGMATGTVRILLRLEGVALLAGMVGLYALWGGSWLLFALLFFVPDVSFAGYLAGPRVGAITYNALHTEIVPIALALTSMALATPLMLSIALVWLAHIGFDRALGYGLKYPAGFGFTHLGRIGR